MAKKEINLPDGVQAVKDKPGVFRFFVSDGFWEDGRRKMATTTRKGLTKLGDITTEYNAFHAYVKKGTYWEDREAKKAPQEQREVKLPTVTELLDRWLTLFRADGLANKTYYDYEQLIKARIKPVLGDREADKLTGEEIQLFFNVLKLEGADRETNKLQRTIKKIHSVLSRAYASGLAEGMVTNNPVGILKKSKATKKEARFYSPNQINKMLAALEKEDIKLKALITTAYYSGARRGELLALGWDDLTVDKKGNGKLRIDKSLQCLPGYGFDIKDPKNEYSKRTVPIPAHVVKLLEKHKAAQRETSMLLRNKWEDKGRIFTSSTGGYMNPNRCGRIFSDFQARHGLPRLNFHGLRHSFCTTRLYAGEPVIKVAGLMGHRDTTMVNAIYGHICKDDVDEYAADTIDTLLSKQARAAK